ncbi:MAG TPA: class I SAM-dependent methyltransferase, partial [Candidatus Binatia bacterium]|nr:class I SAM-dependent methyltransferase [Candidatus Binatia bacterium]
MRYAGSELELFAAATRWKSYALGGLRALARGRVLEVGAGRGANVAYLAGPAVTRWVCLEPDPALLSAIARDDPRVEPIEGTSEQLADRPSSFDTVFYIDVLEHIADDAGELER